MSQGLFWKLRVQASSQPSFAQLNRYFISTQGPLLSSKEHFSQAGPSGKNWALNT